MLIKIGDVWVDPMRVTAIESVESDPYVEDVVPTEDGQVDITIGSAQRETPGCRLVLDTYATLMVLDVSADDAAQAINRCREIAGLKRYADSIGGR